MQASGAGMSRESALSKKGLSDWTRRWLVVALSLSWQSRTERVVMAGSKAPRGLSAQGRTDGWWRV